MEPRFLVRGDCLAGGSNSGRPCPQVQCRHHLSVDTGKLDGETCSLDLADRGGMTLEEISEILGVTRERVRQIESKAMRKLWKTLRVRPDFSDFKGPETVQRMADLFRC